MPFQRDTGLTAMWTGFFDWFLVMDSFDMHFQIVRIFSFEITKIALFQFSMNPIHMSFKGTFRNSLPTLFA